MYRCTEKTHFLFLADDSLPQENCVCGLLNRPACQGGTLSRGYQVSYAEDIAMNALLHQYKDYGEGHLEKENSGF